MRGFIGTTMVALSVAGVLQAQEPVRRSASPPPPPAKAAQPRIGYAATPAQPAAPVRACGKSVNAAQAEQNATGKDALGRILPPPGIAALQAGTPGQITGNAPARNAQSCYRNGR